MKDIVCDSCGKQRETLIAVVSKLMESMKFNLCNHCNTDEFQMEPRWLLILVGRQGENVEYWVNNRLYCGEDVEPLLN